MNNNAGEDCQKESLIRSRTKKPSNIRRDKPKVEKINSSGLKYKPIICPSPPPSSKKPVRTLKRGIPNLINSLFIFLEKMQVIP